MARRALRCGRRKPCRNVVRYVSANRCGALERRLVAPVTIGGIERVAVIHMAGDAGRRRRRHMRAGQRKSSGAVIERRSVPAHRGVARGAIRRGKGSSGGGVRRGVGLLPGCQMAPGISAVGRRNR